MKIEHESKVRVVPYQTIEDALLTGLSKDLLNNPYKRIIGALRLNRKTPEERELSEVLREPLWGEYYERTLALASLEQEMGVHELYQELARDGYCPAGISEEMPYLRILAARGVEVDVVFHLGTSLRTSTLTERRLLTKKNGDIELVPFYHVTRLKSYYKIIVAKEEKGRPRK